MKLQAFDKNLQPMHRLIGSRQKITGTYKVAIHKVENSLASSCTYK